ncbi:5-bromo-4-chloroindolyl phosphate hydrolysis family protein [Bacillus sp. REN3]|uniref:5-bromo-4-chloroindolyl phosphate hydrolysis family protein n=1 Tax=Bacillus sp. REN3 TaxID=2802440 RepID=UPI001AEDB4B6|nr:5-bromo-4-chloroindolyl phosphate hydrolysis family protein [Bacillus sp. REN3]
MNTFVSFIVRTAVAIPSSVFVWLVSFAGFDQTFLLSSLYALIGGGVVYMGIGAYMNRLFLKKHGLTKKEYRYIRKNLIDAQQKINRLQKALFTVRHIRSLKQRMELLRMIKSIQRLSKREPRRFYKAEKFYFSHLDSVVELSEKYAFLSSQPGTNRELEQSLYETQYTLKELTKAVEKDMQYILSDDLDHLNFEIDVARHSIKKLDEIPDETRRLK